MGRMVLNAKVKEYKKPVSSKSSKSSGGDEAKTSHSVETGKRYTSHRAVETQGNTGG